MNWLVNLANCRFFQRKVQVLAYFLTLPYSIPIESQISFNRSLLGTLAAALGGADREWQEAKEVEVHPNSLVVDICWYDIIWYDRIWYDIVWYDMIWYDMILCDMIWYVFVHVTLLISTVVIDITGCKYVDEDIQFESIRHNWTMFPRIYTLFSSYCLWSMMATLLNQLGLLVECKNKSAQIIVQELQYTILTKVLGLVRSLSSVYVYVFYTQIILQQKICM